MEIKDNLFDGLPCLGTKIADLSLVSFLEEYLPSAIDEESLRENNRDIKQKLASL